MQQQQQQGYFGNPAMGLQMYNMLNDQRNNIESLERKERKLDRLIAKNEFRNDFFDKMVTDGNGAGIFSARQRSQPNMADAKGPRNGFSDYSLESQ
jgi:hypothetical protein